ncbi:MAG: hypothetical protein V1822_01440, partial [Candidatus Micrarchaeota archaeon]
MKEDIELLYQNNVRLTPDAYHLILQRQIPKEAISELISAKIPFLSDEQVNQILSKHTENTIPIDPEKKLSVPAPQVEIIRTPKFSPIAKEYSPKIKVHEHRDVSGQSRCMGTVEDFVAYFRDRYKQESTILKQRTCQYPILRSDQMQKNSGT